MPDPYDYSKPMLPVVHHGKVGKPVQVPKVKDDDDDDAPTQQWVIDELGFDPKK